MNFLKLNNIITQVHYIPLNLHPFLRDKEHKSNKIDQANSYYNDCLSIPIYYDLDNSTQKYIIRVFKQILG